MARKVNLCRGTPSGLRVVTLSSAAPVGPAHRAAARSAQHLLRWALRGPSPVPIGGRPRASPVLPRSCTGSAATHAPRSALKTSRGRWR